MDLLKTEDLTYLLSGISLIFAGISDLASNLYLAFALADYKEALANEKKIEEEIKKEEIIEEEKKDPQDPNV